MIPNSKAEGPIYDIFKYVRNGVKTIDPLAINDKEHVTIRFAVDEPIDEKGFNTKIDVYESDTVVIHPVTLLRDITYNNLIKRTEISYIIGEDEALLTRVETYSFMKNGELIELGSKTKNYKGDAAVDEGIKRRENVINLLKRKTAYYIFLTEPLVVDIPHSEVEAKILGNEIGDRITNFTSFNAYDELVQAIMASTVYYMDNIVSTYLGVDYTIRMLLSKTIIDSRIDPPV